jgi:hypothetical protein
VRDSGVSCPSVAVNIDTLTFDRVLIYLEAYALKRKPPRFAVHLLQDLLQVWLAVVEAVGGCRGCWGCRGC